jgi:NAD(P)-dependent dehydrogenase (short-subunit alcohol dehydrogenase family)/acyl carrier protein
LRPLREGRWIYASLDNADGTHTIIQDLAILDEQGRVVALLEGVQTAQTGRPETDDIDRWLYEVAWQPCARPVTGADTETATRLWLILTDRSGVGAALAERLRSDGHQCVLVAAGEGYERRDEENAVVRPGEAGDLVRLFAELGDSTADLHGVVALWSLDVRPAEITSGTELEAAARRVCLGVVQAVQQVTAWRSLPPRVWLATRGAQAVRGDDTPADPVQATLWGLGRVVATEHPECWGDLVDLDPNASAEQAALSLHAEITTTSSLDDEVAFRDGERYVARLVRYERAVARRRAFRPRPDATYLLTGAFGGVGAQVARWLVTHGARRLILLGRTPLPPRAEWPALDPDSAAGQRARLVRALEAMGAAVHLATVDLANEAALREYLDGFRREGWPPIRGVFHAAAVAHNSLVAHLEGAALGEVLRPKAIGAWLLHQALPDLEVFVLFSSIGGLLGQPGLGAYAAANAFLDALAHARRARGQPALSINWGGWAGLGLATTIGARHTHEHLVTQGIGSFRVDQGLEALDRLLALTAGSTSGPVQVAVLPADWGQFGRDGTRVPGLVTDLVGAAGATVSGEERSARGFRAILAAAEPQERQSLIEEYLQGQIGRVLRLPPAAIAVTQPLGALGLESLTAIELRNRLERDLGLALSATLVWNYPTIATMARYIAQRLGLPLESKPEPAEAAGARPAAPRIDTKLDDVRRLSDAEALARLLGRGAH